METMNSPIYDRLRAFNQYYDEMRANGTYFYMRKLESSSESYITVNGQRLMMLGSNNYLGLTTHPKVKEATIKAVEKYGVGAGSVRLLGGTFELHEELERRIAEFKGTESAIVFSSGYVSNLATISSFLNKDQDLAIIDEKIHASLIDGLRFSRIPFGVFHHNDMADLEKKLKASVGRGNLAIIIDGVYSMDGDVAKLPGVYDLAKQYNALIIIDEAHATGVLGARGRGTPEHFGLHGKIDVVMGTLSKGLGVVGGFAAGSKDLIHYLHHAARGFVFSAALPPASCAALLASLDVLENEPQWVTRLRENADLMRRGLQQLGFNIGPSTTPIIPVMIGEELAAHQLTRTLHALGIYVSPVAFPAVKKGAARLRVSVMATHTPEDILKALNCFEKAKSLVPGLREAIAAQAAPTPPHESIPQTPSIISTDSVAA
jgi:glycine C-acetyltransferase